MGSSKKNLQFLIGRQNISVAHVDISMILKKVILIVTLGTVKNFADYLESPDNFLESPWEILENFVRVVFLLKCPFFQLFL